MQARHLEPGKVKHRFATANFADMDHCPFGCSRKEGTSDERGYCEHYIGMASGGGEWFHGVKYRTYTNKQLQLVHTMYDYLDGTRKLKVTKKHKLVPVTKDLRVYHEEGLASLDKAEVLEEAKPLLPKRILAVT